MFRLRTIVVMWSPGVHGSSRALFTVDVRRVVDPHGVLSESRG